MPRLLLLRHAKSDRSKEAFTDFDRPLNARGRAAAPLMGRQIAVHGLSPQRILCSSARRTRDTLAGLLPHLEGDTEIHLTRDLYLAEEDRLIDQIRAHGVTARTLLVIGHNPGLQQTALALIGSGNPSFIEDIETKFPTSGLAVIDFPAGKWVDIEPKEGRIVAFFRPHQLELIDALPDEEPEA